MNRLARALAGIGIDDLNELHNRFWFNIMVSLAAIFGGIVLNYNGHGSVNAYVYWSLFLVTMFIITRPATLAIFAALEAARRAVNLATANGNPNVSTEGVTKNIILLAPTLVFAWLSIVFMFLTILPLSYFMSFGKAVTASLIALMCISVIGWTAVLKWTVTVVYKKVIVGYAVIGLLLCVIQLPLYFTEGALYGKAGTSESAKEFNKMTYAVKEGNDSDFRQKLDGIRAEYIACRGVRSCLSPKAREIADIAEKLTGDSSPDFSQPITAEYGKKVVQDQKQSPAPSAVPASETQKDSGANKITISGKYKIHATMVEAAKKYGWKNPVETDMQVITSTQKGTTVEFVTQENVYTCELQPNGDCDGKWNPKGKSNGQPLHLHFHSDERADGWIMDGGLKADAIVYGI
jgi:hypothetical protein